MLRLMPWLMAFRRHGSRTGVQRLAHAMNALEAYAAGEHRVLAEAAEALKYYRQTGAISLYRTEAGFEATAAERHYARIFGVDYHELDELDLNELEPWLTADGCRGIFWPETESVSNPGAVTKAFARSLAEKGGRS
ncbi:FAD-dependent oxidoreductase [Pannonibacter sp. Pt2-lr]